MADDPLDIIDWDSRLPNGHPRFITSAREEDDIMYIMVDGREEIVWSDYRITLDGKKGGWKFFMEWKEPKWALGPFGSFESKWLSDYPADFAEAHDSALSEQERIIRERGEYVPIYIRY